MQLQLPGCYVTCTELIGSCTIVIAIRHMYFVDMSQGFAQQDWPFLKEAMGLCRLASGVIMHYLICLNRIDPKFQATSTSETSMYFWFIIFNFTNIAETSSTTVKKWLDHTLFCPALIAVNVNNCMRVHRIYVDLMRYEY